MHCVRGWLLPRTGIAILAGSLSCYRRLLSLCHLCAQVSDPGEEGTAM